MSQCGSINCAMRTVYAVSITSGSPPLRCRMRGTVRRFIGEGVGFARLVDVSKVSVLGCVDMGQGLSR
jgi:hypothetical protein